ncbi:hypothetical protein HDU87_006397 [Geranomyces variabilis]|uniref:SET domain-containing protein n=1 Tax=Geranomyces variabilis TaxID=109894 RepID=A0AAD5XNZ9_9FUNG|nr:hypothetical protein HDU87_006397 [Geranomyces variabilis]
MLTDKPLVKYTITPASDTGDPSDSDYLVKWLASGDTVCVRTKNSIYHGKGLFCAQHCIPKGTLIDHYHGKTMSSGEAHAKFPLNGDTFLLDDFNVVVPHSHIPGRFCNDSVILPADCEGDITYSRFANAAFEQENGTVLVRAVCDIAYDEEIIISYGPLYWRAICFELAGFADLPQRFQRSEKCATDKRTLARWSKKLGFAKLPDYLRLVKVERMKSDPTKREQKLYDHYLLRRKKKGVWRSAKQYALHMEGAEVPDSVCPCEVCQKKERSRNPNKRKRTPKDSGEALDTAPALESSMGSNSGSSSDSDGISGASESSTPSTRTVTLRQYALKTGSAKQADSPQRSRSPPQFVRKSNAHLPASPSRITFDESHTSSPSAPRVTVKSAPPLGIGYRPRKVARKSCGQRPPQSAYGLVMPDKSLGTNTLPRVSTPQALAQEASRTPKSARESSEPSAASPDDISIPDKNPPCFPSAPNKSAPQTPALTAARPRKLNRKATKHQPACSPPPRVPVPERSTLSSPSAPEEFAHQASPPLGTYRKFARKSSGHHPVPRLSPTEITDKSPCSPVQVSPPLSAPCLFNVGRQSIEHRVATPSPSDSDSGHARMASPEAFFAANDPPSSPVTPKVGRKTSGRPPIASPEPFLVPDEPSCTFRNPRVARKASGHAPIASPEPFLVADEPSCSLRNPRVARKSSGHAPMASPEPILVADEPLDTPRNSRVARKSSGHAPMALPEPILVADEPLDTSRNSKVARKSIGHAPTVSLEPFLVPDEPSATPRYPRVVRKFSGHTSLASMEIIGQVVPSLVPDQESGSEASPFSSSSSPPPPCSSSSSPSPTERPVTTKASSSASGTEFDIDNEIDQANIRAALAVAKQARNTKSSDVPAVALAYDPAKDKVLAIRTADASKHAAAKCLDTLAARGSKSGDARADGAACGATIYVLDKTGQLCCQCAFKLALAKVGRVVVLEGGIDAGAAQVLSSLQIAVDETTMT